MTETRSPDPSAQTLRLIQGAEAHHRAGRPLLTVIARVPTRGSAGPIESQRELLACARHLLLFSSSSGDGERLAWYRGALSPDATVTLLPEGPGEGRMADEPGLWLDAAVEFVACRSGAIRLESTVLVTEECRVLVPRPALRQGAVPHLDLLCDLRSEAFGSAWNRHVEGAAPAANLPPLSDVPCHAGPVESEATGELGSSSEDLAARVAELDGQVRELSDERTALRENRDLAKEEHLAELTSCYQQIGVQDARIHELQATVTEHETSTAFLRAEVAALRADAVKAKSEAAALQAGMATLHSELAEYRINWPKQESHLAELEGASAAAAHLAEQLAVCQDELREAASQRETEIECHRAKVDALETLVRRTGAARIAEWLDRMGGLRRKLSEVSRRTHAQNTPPDLSASARRTPTHPE